MIKIDDLKSQLETVKAKLATLPTLPAGEKNAVDRRPLSLDAFRLRMAISLMEYRGISEIHSIGNFVKEGVILPTDGETIIIPKGAQYVHMGATYKGKLPDAPVMKKSQAIVISRISNPNDGGFYEEYTGSPEHIREIPVQIKWAGKGGYWNYMSLNEWIEHGGPELTAAKAAEAELDKAI